MVKNYFKIIPYLILAIIVSGLNAFLDGFANIRIMKLLDFAISGQMKDLKQQIPLVLPLAFGLVPMGILVVMASNLYKRKANTALKKYYLNKVFGKNIAEFQKENNAKYLSSMTNDFNTLENNLITGIYTVFEAVATFMVGIWLLSTVDERMIILAFILIIINMTISLVASKPTKKASKERSDMFDSYTSYIKEILSAFHIVKNYNLQERVNDDYNKKSEEIQQKGHIIEKMFSYNISLQHLLLNGSMFGMILFIGYFAVIGKVSIGGVLLVINGIQKLTGPLFNISENLPKLFSSGDLIRKIEKTLDIADTYVETVSLPDFKEEIEFSNVE